MTLISVIFVLIAERMGVHSKYWLASFYTSAFFGKVSELGWLSRSSSNAAYAGVVLIPSIILLIIVNAIDNSFLSLILNTAILMVCIGCPMIREAYKCYLQAANRGDIQACSMYARELDDGEGDLSSFAHNLVWANYQHYAAVIIWFVILGPAGAVMYVLARTGLEKIQSNDTSAVETETKTDLENNEAYEYESSASKLMHILDWVPVRITALGLLLVGHFSRAMPIWLEHFAEINISAKSLLRDVTKAAEEIEPEEDDCTEEPCTLVRLAKRNIMFLVVVISLLSMTGIVS